MNNETLQLLENIRYNNVHADILRLNDLFNEKHLIPTDFYSENPNPSMCGKNIFDIPQKCIAIYYFYTFAHLKRRFFKYANYK